MEPREGGRGAEGNDPEPGQPGSATRTRVAFYCDAHEVGGAEISLGHLLELLNPEIEAVVLGTDRDVVNGIASRRAGAETILLPAIRDKRDLTAILAHARGIWRMRPDILHISLNRPWGSQWAVISGLLMPGVRVIAVEKLPRPAEHLKHRIYKRLTSRFLDGHVTLGERTALEVAAISGVPRNSITTIPSGVIDAPRRQLSRPCTGPVIGSLGRLNDQKGYDVLIRALVDLPEVTAVIVGDGLRRGSLVELAESLGVSGRVVLTGWSDRPGDHLTTFDLYVQPSRFEAQGIANVEAMLAELPVVASDVGGLPDVVEDGVTGLLVPPEDPAALADAIRRLLADPERMGAMGRAGRKRALSRFTAERMTSQFERLYADLLSRKPA